MGASATTNLLGHKSPDRVRGDEGSDTVESGDGNDSVAGGTEGDALFGEGDNDQLRGEAGGDFLDGGGGDDLLVGGEGADRLSGDGVLLFIISGSDTLRGGLDDDTLTGGNRDDEVRGDAGNDQLVGGNDNDVLIGGAGNDTLTGGIGADTMSGGLGKDRFAFLAINESGGAPGTPRDRIEDFVKGERIDVSAIDADPTTAGDQAFVLDTGGGFTIGELKQTVVANGVLVSLNADANPGPELTILVVGALAPLPAAGFDL